MSVVSANLDHRQIGALEVGAELPVLARALDDQRVGVLQGRVGVLGDWSSLSSK
jgi:hypothetical protein